MNSAFIPQGADSPELIHIATGLSVTTFGTEITAMLDSPSAIGGENSGVKEKIGEIN